MVVHLIIDDFIELIWRPFEFFPFCLDPGNHYSKARFFELTGIGSLLRVRLVMKFIRFLVTTIGSLLHSRKTPALGKKNK